MPLMHTVFPINLLVDTPNQSYILHATSQEPDPILVCVPSAHLNSATVLSTIARGTATNNPARTLGLRQAQGTQDERPSSWRNACDRWRRNSVLFAHKTTFISSTLVIGRAGVFLLPTNVAPTPENLPKPQAWASDLPAGACIPFLPFHTHTAHEHLEAITSMQEDLHLLKRLHPTYIFSLQF